MGKRRAGVVPFQQVHSQSRDGTAPCTVTFAHNVKDGRVGMLFSGPITALALTPEQAESVAEQLIREAARARGETADPL